MKKATQASPITVESQNPNSEEIVVVLDEKNPNIRNSRDGTMINLEVNNGVHTMDTLFCVDARGQIFRWQGQ